MNPAYVTEINLFNYKIYFILCYSRSLKSDIII